MKFTFFFVSEIAFLQENENNGYILKVNKLRYIFTKVNVLIKLSLLSEFRDLCVFS